MLIFLLCKNPCEESADKDKDMLNLGWSVEA